MAPPSPLHPLTSLLALVGVAGSAWRPSLSPLAELWTYIVAGGTSIITEEMAPILGGFGAHNGELGLKRVFIAIAIGSWAGGVALYFLGRWRGHWVMRRWRTLGRYVKRALGAVRRRPWRSSLLVRFAFGARVVLPLACGAARVRMPVFLIGSGISAVLWTAVFVFVGWEFGEAAKLMLHHVRRYEDALALGIVVVLGTAFYVTWRRQRAAARDLPPSGHTGEFESVTGPRPGSRR